MDLNQLHYFTVVAETENITKAAQKLYITQPALSRAIGRLESELDVKLFDRRTNTLILNEDGQLFLRHVTMGLDTINSGVHAIRQKNLNRQVLVSNYVFLDCFAAFCDRCLTRFPDVDLVNFDGTRTVSDYPTDTYPDLVIIPQRDFRSYTVVRAYLEPWCIMFHQDYTFRSNCNGKSITIEQLRQESIIFDNSPYDRNIIMDLFQDIPANLKFATQSDSSRIAVNRCRAVGIVPISAYMSLRKRVEDTPIKAMQISDYRLERTIYLSHSPSFLGNAEDYKILELLDRHIQLELDETTEFAETYFSHS